MHLWVTSALGEAKAMKDIWGSLPQATCCITVGCYNYGAFQQNLGEQKGSDNIKHKLVI